MNWNTLSPDGLSGGLNDRGSKTTIPGFVSSRPLAPVDPTSGDCARAVIAVSKMSEKSVALMAIASSLFLREPPVGNVMEALQVDCWSPAVPNS